MTHPTDDPLREPLELLPCPFCGGEAERRNPDHPHGGMVNCKRCGAEAFGPKWNARAALAAAPQPATPGQRMIRAAEEAVAIARGEAEPASVYPAEIDWGPDVGKEVLPPYRPAPVDREALVEVIDKAMRSTDMGMRYNAGLAADDLLARGLRLPGAEETMTDAARDVLAERRRQISVEGWTPEHDDLYNDIAGGGDLAHAAACYAIHAAEEGSASDPAPRAWPWDAAWWKPSTPRRDLVKAGALILAEIERMDRAAIRVVEGGDDAA